MLAKTTSPGTKSRWFATKHPGTRACMRFDELEDQRGQQHSEGEQPDSDKSRFQDLLSAPLMVWPGVVHYRLPLAATDGAEQCLSDLLRCPEALPLELQPKLSEVREDQPHTPVSNIAAIVQLSDVRSRDRHPVDLQGYPPKRHQVLGRQGNRLVQCSLSWHPCTMSQGTSNRPCHFTSPPFHRKAHGCGKKGHRSFAVGIGVGVGSPSVALPRRAVSLAREGSCSQDTTNEGGAGNNAKVGGAGIMQKQVAFAKRRILAEPPPAHLERNKRRTSDGWGQAARRPIGSA